MSFAAFKMYVGHRSLVFICRSVIERFSDLCTLLLPTVCVRTVCVNVEQKNAKLNNRTWLNGLLTIGEHQKFLEGGKFINGGASVACVVSHRCPGFWHHVGILVLPDTSKYSTF